ncbi:MAG: hypothetical protein M1546_12275 [Chloroflexi bacterium]|nr:hypothetical protein [Chloroflexota bacterium]
MPTQTKEPVRVHKGNGTHVVREATEVVERKLGKAALPEAAISPEVEDKVQAFIDNYIAYLKERTDAYTLRLQAYRQAQAKPRPEISAPMLASGYQYWNCLTVGPIQFTLNPPYQPSKIIAAGEPALMLGVVWINPANSDGGGLPGTVVLGGRDYRVRFETMNLTDVADGPDMTFAGTFANPAAVVNVFPWLLIPPDPGPNPAMYETMLTADIVQMGQPLAAFSTWHLDLDTEPPFLTVPAQGPHWQFEIPARFMVYRE